MSALEIAALVWMMGFVIGLGAVTVIETMGFLAQRSGYWTLATIRTHRVTKPLIWLGLLIAAFGGAGYYSLVGPSFVMVAHGIILLIMMANGAWLTFFVSPRLLAREQAGRSTEILPKTWQAMITVSFCISIVTWWSALILAVMLIVP